MWTSIATLLCMYCWKSHGQNTCPSLVPSQHQLLSATDAYVGDAAIIVTCEPGYILASGALQKALLCLDVDSMPTWDQALGYCVRKPCPSLALGPFMTASANTSYYGDAVNVMCVIGYAFAVDLTATEGRVTSYSTLTCMDDAAAASGVWSDIIGTCSVIDCGAPPEVKHSFSVYTTTTFGSDVLFQCHSGYGFTTATFTSHATCNATANWHSNLGPDWAFDDNIKCAALQKWLGCMENGSIVVDEILVTAPIGAGTCHTYCKTSNYRFSGVNTDTCYCGNALVDNYNSTVDEACNMTCPDYNITVSNTEPFCGGQGGRLSVFVSLDGCFVNANLSGYSMETVEEELVVTCRERCRGQDTSHAGISVNMCYCINNMTEDPGDEIGAGYCSSNNTDHVRIYDLAKRPRLGSSCESLYTRGIRMNGQYYLTGKVNKTQCYFKDGTQCEAGWVGYAGNCYYFHTGGTMNFTDARAFCHAREAELVSITSKEEYLFLHETRTVFSDLEDVTSVSANWHLGLVDTHDSNLFSWLDGNLLSYSAFQDSEPDQDKNDCAVDHPTDEKALWQDAKCSQNENVMCKRALYDYGCADVNVLTPLFSQGSNTMTLLECIQLCRGQGTTYSVVRGSECGCVDDLPLHTNFSKANCNIPCPGDPYQYCGEGGAGTKSVIVKATDGRLPAKSCEELQLVGIGDGEFELKPQTTLVTQYCGLPECPHSWIKINGNCYKFNLNAMSADDAQLVCAKYDAYPVVIETIDEVEMIATTIKNISIYKAKKVWRIGVESLSKNAGIYRWANGRIFDIASLNNTFIKHDGLFMTINTTDPAIWKTSINPSATITFICEKGPEYVGCYNSSGITTAHNITGYDQMTIQQCVEYCRNCNEPYAYLAPTDCLCSSLLAVPLDPTKTTCSSVCAGQANQLCGGVGMVTLYKVDEYASFATSCEDLFAAGIFLSGNYKVNGTSTECHLKDGTLCDNGWIGYNGDCYTYLPTNSQGPTSTCLVDGTGARIASLASVDAYTFVVDYLKRRYFNNFKGDMTIYSGISDVYELETFMNADGALLDNSLVTGGYIELSELGLQRPDLLFNLANGLTLDDNQGNAVGTICKTDKANRGCFTKPSNITPILETLNWMETTLCKQLCIGQLLTLALIGGNICMCTNVTELDSMTSTNSSDCYVECNKFAGGYCGQNDVVWALDVDADDVATDCNSLYLAGVFNKATYKLRNGTGYMMGTCGISDSTECPATWFGHNGECYKFLIYKKIFTDAVQDCLSRDGYMFNPTNSSSVNAFVDETVAALSFFGGYQRFRTGIMVANYNTSFVTSDGHMVNVDYSTDNSIMLPLTTVIYQTDTVSYWTRETDTEELPYICQSNQDYYGCNVIISPSDEVMDLPSGMSVTFCMEYCHGQDAVYLAIASSTCHCFVAMPTMVRYPGYCLTPCDGVASQPCGGTSDNGGKYYSVFKISTARHVPASCADLFRYGVGTPGWYYIQPPASPQTKVYCFDNSPPLSALQVSRIKSAIASSSKDGYEATKAIYSFPKKDVWKSSVNQAGEFVKIVTTADFIVTGLTVFGLHTHSEQSWVSQIGVSYREKVTGQLEVYNGGNINASTNGIDGANVIFQSPFVTNEIYVHPKVWTSSISMSIQVLGQLFTNFDHVNMYVGCYGNYGDENLPLGSAATVDICIDTCKSSGYAYASLDTSDICTCVNSGFPHGMADYSDCPTVADGSRRGKTLSLALYRTYEMECPSPPVLNITNGAVSTTTYPYQDGIYTYGTSVMYVCNTGYAFNDVNNEGVITCLLTNEWSIFNKTCEIITCPAFTVVNGSTAITSLEYQGQATVTCDTGFWAPNSDQRITVHCETSRNWTIVPTCTVENFKITQRTFQHMGDKSRAVAAMFDEQNARSIIDCAAKCTQSYFCRGANYQTSGTTGPFGICRLFSEISDGNDLSDDLEWNYFETDMP